MGLEVFSYRDEAAVYGLASVLVAAGVSKFVVPELWLGYEPAWLLSLIPVSPGQFMLASGAFEAILGSAVASGYSRRMTGSVATLWLLGISVTVASMGLWTIALRDLGLVVLAYVVASGKSGANRPR